MNDPKTIWAKYTDKLREVLDRFHGAHLLETQLLGSEQRLSWLDRYRLHAAKQVQEACTGEINLCAAQLISLGVEQTAYIQVGESEPVHLVRVNGEVERGWKPIGNANVKRCIQMFDGMWNWEFTWSFPESLIWKREAVGGEIPFRLLMVPLIVRDGVSEEDFYLQIGAPCVLEMLLDHCLQYVFEEYAGTGSCYETMVRASADVERLTPYRIVPTEELLSDLNELAAPGPGA